MVAAENTDAASPVTTVYWLPAKEVRSPKPLGARVIAAPPAEVMTVATFPPIAIEIGELPLWDAWMCDNLQVISVATPTAAEVMSLMIEPPTPTDELIIPLLNDCTYLRQ